MSLSLESRVTSLQMLRPPSFTARPDHPARPLLVRVAAPALPYYRDLYNRVGGPWLWADRRRLDDASLQAILQHPETEVLVLFALVAEGLCPAGYAELDGRRHPDLELAYFGLLPEFVGSGLGTWLMRRALERAWSKSPRRVWLHTCTLDHPGALEFYCKSGFEPYDERTESVDDPRGRGWI